MSSRAADRRRADEGLLRTQSSGRSGRVWERIKQAVLEQSRICGICGHDGADSVDHIIARNVRPDLAEDPDNLQPAHGVAGCPVCGRMCNGDKGDRPVSEMLITTEDWFA